MKVLVLMVSIAGLILAFVGTGLCLLGIRLGLELIALGFGYPAHHWVTSALAACFGTLAICWACRKNRSANP